MPKSRVKLRQYGVRINGVLIRKSFASAAEARAWQRAQKDLQDQIRSGSKKHLSPTLLTVHAADWLRARQDMASFGHQETWMGKYLLPRPKFQGKLLNEITKADWKEVFGLHGELCMKHGLSPATHNRIRAMVHRMYEDARREFEPPRATENPIHDIPPLEEAKKKHQILSDREEIRRYIEAAYKDPLQACWGIFVAIKLNTGLRQQNIMPLRWKDWINDGTALHVREKYVRTKSFTGFLPGSKSGADERITGVNNALRAALDAWRKVSPHPGPEDFIAATADGSFLSQRQLWDANVRSCAAAGLPYLSEHKLRHSFATHYLDAGGNVHDLMQILFHANLTTTQIYVHTLRSHLAKRADVFQTAAPSPEAPSAPDSESKQSNDPDGKE